MKCPYCENEMKKGMIISSQELSYLRGSACEAYNCPECKKIVIDYGDKYSDLNYYYKDAE